MRPSPRDLVAAANASVAEMTSRQIAESVARAPFDRELPGAKDAPGRQRIQSAVNSLVQQRKDLVAAAHAVGITRLTLVQP